MYNLGTAPNVQNCAGFAGCTPRAAILRRVPPEFRVKLRTMNRVADFSHSCRVPNIRVSNLATFPCCCTPRARVLHTHLDRRGCVAASLQRRRITVTQDIADVTQGIRVHSAYGSGSQQPVEHRHRPMARARVLRLPAALFGSRSRRDADPARRRYTGHPDVSTPLNRPNYSLDR
eukprot:COSAG02_NODE_381_length_23450_cov_65.782493_14_plen_175_part_00